MSASGVARGAADEMKRVQAVCNQIDIMLAQVRNLIANASSMTDTARGTVAGATQTVTGGSGRGQQLQVRVGQTTVKLGELSNRVTSAGALARETSQHAAGVERDIREWANELSR